VFAENELMNKRKEAEEWNAQRELDLQTIQEMHECITKLQCEKNSTLNESANLEEELALARVRFLLYTVFLVLLCICSTDLSSELFSLNSYCDIILTLWFCDVWK